MASTLHLAGMLIATLGIFLGFYFLPSQPRTSIAIVTFTCVGVVGVLAFVRHVIFHRSDAERLGWRTDRPDWQFEVGFANLAFGLMAFLAVVGVRELSAHGLILLGYAAYLVQAAALHLFRYLTETPRSPARLWRSVLATLLYAGMVAYFGVRAFQA